MWKIILVVIAGIFLLGALYVAQENFRLSEKTAWEQCNKDNAIPNPSVGVSLPTYDYSACKDLYPVPHQLWYNAEVLKK